VLHCEALLRPEEVAAALRMPQRRVYQLREDGTLQQVKVVSSFDYPAAAFSNFSQQNLETATATAWRQNTLTHKLDALSALEPKSPSTFPSIMQRAMIYRAVELLVELKECHRWQPRNWTK
jgi:hypothetical protein